MEVSTDIVDIEALKKDLAAALALVHEKNRKIANLEALLRLANHRRFGPSSEKYEGMTCLFDEAESEASKAPEPSKVKGFNRKKPGPKPIPDDIPREDIIYDLTEAERVCDCGCQMTSKGEVITERLDIIPAKARVIRHIEKKYSCNACDSRKKAARPPEPLPGILGTPGLLALIVVGKFVDGLPLNRIEKTLKRAGINITRATLANWVIKLGKLCIPLLNIYRDEVLTSPVLHADETTIQVLKENGRKAASKSFMWVLARDGPNPIILFNYNSRRTKAVAEDLLEDFQGFLVTDGYAGYDSVSRRPYTIRCGCWDHARRKFADAIKSLRKDERSKPTIAGKALEYIGMIYEIERAQKESTPEFRLKARQLYTKSVLTHLERWLNQVINTVPPKSLTGVALNYLNNQWPELTQFMTAGVIPISNAMAERAIRPFAIGRRAWLFADTPDGADGSAAMYSLVCTAKANGLDEHRYLTHVFTQLAYENNFEDLEKLLPWNVEFSEESPVI